MVTEQVTHLVTMDARRNRWGLLRHESRALAHLDRDRHLVGIDNRPIGPDGVISVSILGTVASHPAKELLEDLINILAHIMNYALIQKPLRVTI